MKRFWDKVDIKGKDECWEWKAGKSRSYGMFLNKETGKVETAHRFSYRLTYGKIEKGKLICHKCDNRGCVNPNHLYQGDKGTNAADCKGRTGRVSRWYKGELWLIRHLHSKEIAQGAIAKMFKVSSTIISRIVKDPNYSYKGMNRYQLRNLNVF